MTSSSNLISNVDKIRKLENKSNYNLWRKDVEGVLLLAGLWSLVSGERPKPQSETPSTSASESSTIGAGTSTTLQTWLSDARNAWTVIDLSLSDGLRHISDTFQKEDPIGLWKFLEKKFQPDTALEATRRYRQLLELEPREGETTWSIIDRLEKAKNELTRCVGDVNVDQLLGSLVLYKMMREHRT